MRVKSQVLGDGNPLSRPATNINPTDTRCLRASFASYNKRCKRISLLLLIGLLVVLVAVVGRALREFERIQRLWREAATKAVNERQIQQAQTPLLFRHHWGSVLRQEYKPRTYLEHAMRIADPEIENNKCDYFNNGEFLADFLALPHLECGNSELLADTWKFGDDLAEYGETYMSKKIETGGVAAFNGWLVHMQKKLSTYMADKKKKKEFNYAEVQQENDLIEQDIHTDRGNSENQFKWRNSNTPITAEPSSKTASRIRCGTLDTNIPQRYCETRNLAIKLDLLPKMPDRRKGQDLPAIFGSMETLCHLDENSWFGRGFGGGAAGWMFDGMEVLNPKENENIQCDLWLDTPLFFISRWDTTNPFQFHQDAMNTFLVYSLLNISADAIQPILLDQRNSDGPYTKAWSHIFTSSRRLVDLRQLSKAAKRRLENWKGNGSPNLCVRRAIWGIHGGISPMARDGGKKSNCVGSPLFQAFREFVLDRGRYWDTRNVFGQIGNNKNDNRKRVGKEKLPDWLPFPVKTQKYGLMFEESVRRIFFAGITRGGPRSWSAAKRMMDRTIVVTFARRQSSTLHGYLDEGGVFGLQLHGVDGTDVKPPKDFVEGSEPKLKRIVKNEATLIEMLRNETKNWEKESTVPVEFRAVDFAAISFDDQLAISRGTDLFVGPHGASFAWTMYLRRLPVAGVLELKPPERGVGNQQFQNMAKRYGYGYQFVPIGPTVSGEQMDRIVSSMRILLDDIHRGRITLAE